jgi:serine/threonine protein kinase
MSIDIGKVVADRYKVEEKIGEGGMQQVWRSLDLSLGRQVVVKVPIVMGAKRRFVQSAQLSARVRHANVAIALDYALEGDAEFYVEEFIDGMNLQECMDKHYPRLDADTAARVMHHLAKGVAASHSAGVLHRDLKPSNVMVSKDLSFDTIKITDFGIAKLAELEIDRGTENIAAAQTQGLSSTMLGAIPFLAPEVLRKGKPNAPPIGKASDVWSLAAMGYWMLSGEHPFGEGFDAVPGIFAGQPKEWDKSIAGDRMTSELATKLQSLITSCFELKPEERPSADALVADIAALAYLSGVRQTGKITRPGPHGGVWFGESDRGHQMMTHDDEVMAGAKLKSGTRISYVAFPGNPNPRAVAVIRLKDRTT